MHPAERGDLDVVDAPPRPLTADQFGLVEPVHGLGQGVVIGISDGADRGSGADLGEAFGVTDRRELTARVGVTDQPFEAGAALPAGWMKELTGRSPMKSPGAPAHRREVERLFWDEIARGLTSEDAAAVGGVSSADGTRWFRQRGGMSPFGAAR